MGPYIDPWQLEIVLVMAEELNTYKAAERLKVDQSTVSKGIKRFEKKPRAHHVRARRQAYR